MTEQHMNGDTVAFWIVGKIFRFYLLTEFAFFFQLQNRSGSELLGDRPNSVFCLVGIRYRPFPVGQPNDFWKMVFPF